MSAPIAEKCTKVFTPHSVASFAICDAPLDCKSVNFCLLVSFKIPTQFTTASAPIIAARVDFSSRIFANIGSTCPTSPYVLTKRASFGRRTATLTRHPSFAIL